MMWLLMCMVLSAAPSSTQKQLESLQEVIRSSASTSQQRTDALQERLAIRAQAMSDDGIDEAVQARMACDQAEDLLSTGLGLDRLGLNVLYGYPTRAERIRAEAHITAGLAAVARAELLVEQMIFTLERIPASRRTALQRETLLHLREQERDLRLPLLRGIGLVHRAQGYEEEAARQATMREAEASLFELDERLEGRSSPRASWLRGLALARLGRYEEAEDAFRVAATNANAGTDEILAARLGGVVNRSMKNGADGGIRSAALLLRRYGASSQLRDHVLVVDHLAALHAGIGDVGGAAQAWNGLQPILIEGGLDDATSWALIDERIRRLPVTDPIGSGSAELVLAHMSRPELDPAPLAGALRSALSSTDITEDQRARAMLGLGAALARDHQPLEASRVLLELASTMPRRREAGPAIDGAARLALETSVARPGDDAARLLATEALDRMLSDFPYRPGIDGWRVAAARLAAADGHWSKAIDAYDAVISGSPQEQDALQEGAMVLLRASRDPAWNQSDVDVTSLLRNRGQRGDEHTKTIIDLLLVEALLDHQQEAEASDVITRLAQRGLTTDQQAALDTLRLRAAEGDAEAIATAARGVAERGGSDGGAAIASALRQSLKAIDDESARTGRTPDAESLRTEVEPVGTALEQWLQQQQSDDAASWLLVAQAHRRMSRSREALAIIDSLLQESPDAGDVLFERAENLHALGGEEHLSQAMLIYRRLGRAARDSSPRRWWWSQLRMLQILAALDRNTDRIGPRIRLLMNDDATLGGTDTRQGFESLLIQYP